jgi:uncharacterized protein (TIGR02266 family)
VSSGTPSLVEQVREYRRLDLARRSRALSPDEEARWVALKAGLESKVLVQGAEANRRESSRVPITLDVSFPDRPAFRRSYIRNISGGGVFIETDDAIPIGTRIRVHMDFAGRPVACTCECVWINKAPTSEFGRGVGLKFLDLTPEQTQFIHGLVFRAMEHEARSREKLTDAMVKDLLLRPEE